MDNIRNFWMFSLLIFVKAIAVTAFLFFSPVALGPDEAQYWTWSKALEWGYYSKPPAIAAQVWLGTKLFGDTEFGVRFLTIVMTFITSIGVYLLARACRLKANTAFWAGVIFAFSPLGIVGSLYAVTDVGLLFFWTAASIIIASSLSVGVYPSYFLLGFFIACGALFKWTIFLFWPLLFALFPFFPFLARKRVILGVLVSLLGLLPPIIWNASNNWATFRHVFGQIVGKTTRSEIFQGNALDFFGAQFLLFSPLFFLLLVISFFYLWKSYSRTRTPVIFCGMFSLIGLLTFLIASIFQKIQGNWCVFIYPTASVFTAWFVLESGKVNGKRWLRPGVSLSIIISTFLIAIPWIQKHHFLSRYPVPYTWNPFRHQLGWREMDAILHKVGYNPEEQFLFGDKYQMTSILSFYSQDKKPALFLNLRGARQNHYSFSQKLENEIGKSGYYIVIDNFPYLDQYSDKWTENTKKLLGSYFQHVSFLDSFSLFESYGKQVKIAYLFQCENYNGKVPADPNSY